jgi:hypothetical protein
LNKQGTTGKRKHRTLVPHKSEVIRELRSGENQREVIQQTLKELKLAQVLEQ